MKNRRAGGRGLLVSVVLAVLVGSLLRADTARACSFAGPTLHKVDPALQSTDRTAPTWAAPATVHIKRGKGSHGSGCGSGARGSSCDDLGVITLTPGAVDDMTAADRVGYRLSVVKGAPPPLLELSTEAIDGTSLTLLWIDGAVDDQEAFAFRLSVTAIDAAGNESAPREIEVADDGDSPGACRLARGGAPTNTGGTAALALALLIGAARRRAR